jgi:hypothetical protein
VLVKLKLCERMASYFRPDMPRPFSGNDRRQHGTKTVATIFAVLDSWRTATSSGSFFDFQTGRPPSPSPDGSQNPDRNRVCLAPDQVRAHGARPRPSSAQHREWIGLPGRVWPDHAGAAAIVAEAFCWCRVRAGRFFGGRDAGDRACRAVKRASALSLSLWSQRLARI